MHSCVCVCVSMWHRRWFPGDLDYWNIQNMPEMYILDMGSIHLNVNESLTLPLSTLRAADNSDCGMTPFSAPKVLTTDDTADGMDNPWEFSARTKNMYDVAGLSSPICNRNLRKKKNVRKFSKKQKNQSPMISFGFRRRSEWYPIHTQCERIIYFRDRFKE